MEFGLAGIVKVAFKFDYRTVSPAKVYAIPKAYILLYEHGTLIIFLDYIVIYGLLH